MIALGESLLAAGATFSELASSTTAMLPPIAGFLTTVSLWWVYFVRDAPSAEKLIERTPDATRMGGNGFAFAHGAMVAGIIVVAVAVDLTMEHPGGSVGLSQALALLGGPAL